MTKMTVTRALAELKRLDDRIQRAQGSSAFVAVTIGKDSFKKVHGNSISVEDNMKGIRSNMESLLALYTNRETIKGQLVLSNATTKVAIGGKSLTVAEAIELKKSIELKRSLVNILKSQFNSATNIAATLNTDLEKKIDALLTTVYGNEKGKAETSMVEAVSKPQRDSKEAAVLDVLDLVNTIKKLEEEISLVDTELDFTLSESNAKTEIEV